MSTDIEEKLFRFAGRGEEIIERTERDENSLREQVGEEISMRAQVGKGFH